MLRGSSSFPKLLYSFLEVRLYFQLSSTSTNLMILSKARARARVHCTVSMDANVFLLIS